MEPTQTVEFSTTQTHWKNPTPKPVIVDIYVGAESVPGPARPYRRGERHQAHLRIRWAPGETKALPSIYDSAIHDVRNGVVVGGKAPQLVRADQPGLPVADAIDVEKSKRREALAEATAALAAKQVAEESLVLAGAKADEAQRSIDTVEEMKAAADADLGADDLSKLEGAAKSPKKKG